MAAIVRCDRCNYEANMATDDARKIYSVPSKWARINDLPLLLNVTLCGECVLALVKWIRPERKP